MLYDNEAIKKRKDKELKIKKVINYVIYICLIPILIYNFSLIMQSLINPNKTPSFFGIKTYVIISGSMEPNISIGDIVITQRVEEEELQVGDIISYRKGQSIITHRIVSIDYNEAGEMVITTKGDNNNAEDSEMINYNSIEGKVKKIIPKIGNISLLVQNKIVIIIILLIVYIYISREIKIKNQNEVRRLKRLNYEEIHRK